MGMIERSRYEWNCRVRRKRLTWERYLWK